MKPIKIDVLGQTMITLGRKHRDTCSIRHFLHFSSHSRTCGTDRNVLMKYESRISGFRSNWEDPVRVFAPAARLLSMNVPCPLLFYAFSSLRLFPSSLSLSHCHSLSLSLPLSLSHCIHFCAFKKSPRITNLAESELNGVTEDYKRKPNKDGPGDAFGLSSLPPPFIYLFLHFFKSIIPACE